ncbi:MAG: Ldh family oxidoreductase [Bacteroidota bacterium]|nr:Ldh family oxidoreductase [Bacteroidota bacterium]
MNGKIVRIDINILEKFIKDVLKKVGVPADDAAICADVLIAADKRGIDSHGINRLKSIYYDRIKQGIVNSVTDFEIIKNSPTTALIDGHNGMGHVIAKKSMQMAIDKAKEYGMGMVAVRNSSHYGIAGYYALMAEANGMIGVAGTNARPSIAPTFGIEAMLGTNPLTFAMPTDEDFPFLLDCATSITQRGKIEVYEKEKKDCHPGWVIGHDGNTKTNSAEILKEMVDGTAALLPLGGAGEEMGGYKGYGYATVVEILCAALQSGNYLQLLTGFRDGKKVPYNLGHFFIAINIENFIELDEFRKTSGNILREIRSSKKMPGAERIYTPGEKEYINWMERKEKGVPINEEVLNEMLIMQKDLGLTEYNFQ